MLKYFIGVVLTLIAAKVIAQSPVYFQQNGDTVILYLSIKGYVTTSSRASYKRVAFIEKERLAFEGSVFDYYYPEGDIAFKATYKNGLINGQIQSYYRNGNVKEIGVYRNSKRDSIWTFYYKNGIIEKRIDYSNDQSRLVEFYKKSGKPVFVDGNGTYKGYSNKDYFSCDLYQIKGDLKDGLMEGSWTIDFGYSKCTEVFENGVFISGRESPQWGPYNSASLISISGFPYYENIILLNYAHISERGDPWPFYNGNFDLREGFLLDFKKSLETNMDLSGFFYALIEFQLDNGAINPNSFKSITNNNEIFNEIKSTIISLKKWNKPKDDLVFTIYLPIFWDNGLIYLKPSDKKIID